MSVVYIFIKGFSTRLDESCELPRKRMLRKIKELVTNAKRHDFKVQVCWDGDNYAKDSFTHAIKMLMDWVAENQYENVEFHACKKQSETKGFIESWAKQRGNHIINIKIMDDNLSWDQLGIQFLRNKLDDTSFSKKYSVVYCLGGGKTIKKEIEEHLEWYKDNEKARNKLLTWYMFPVTRPTEKGEGREKSIVMIPEPRYEIAIMRPWESNDKESVGFTNDASTRHTFLQYASE